MGKLYFMNQQNWAIYFHCSDDLLNAIHASNTLLKVNMTVVVNFFYEYLDSNLRLSKYGFLI